MVAVWQTGYDKLPDPKKKGIEELNVRDVARRAKLVEDLGWRPMPADFQQYVRVMSLTDHLSTIVSGLDEHYHFRRTECGCTTTNATWPHTVAAGGGQYWCPGTC